MLSTAYCAVISIVVVIDEEESVAPVVSVETFEGGGEVFTAEVVERLEVGLGICSLSECEYCDGCSDKDFFGHKM